MQDPATTVVQAALDRTGLAPELVADVVLGQGYPYGEAPALDRIAALDGGHAGQRARYPDGARRG